MQAVNVQTTQNIELEYPLAGVGERILALLIDFLIIFSFMAVVALGLNRIIGYEPKWLTALITIIGFLYRFFAELLYNGQTVGKNVLKIKVVKLDGSAPSVAAYFLRWLMEPLDFFILGLGVLLVILTRKGQRLGDLLGGTTVIKIKKINTTNVRNKMIVKQVNEDYVPTYPQAGNISDAEVRIIKEALKAFREDAADKPVSLVVQKLKEKYHIESEEPAVKFLYTLLKDHTFYVEF